MKIDSHESIIVKELKQCLLKLTTKDIKNWEELKKMFENLINEFKDYETDLKQQVQSKVEIEYL